MLARARRSLQLLAAARLRRASLGASQKGAALVTQVRLALQCLAQPWQARVAPAKPLQLVKALEQANPAKRVKLAGQAALVRAAPRSPRRSSASS